MAKKTNIHPGFDTIYKEVLPYLEHYCDDVKVHDRNTLIKYEGDFVCLYRKQGTNLFLIDSLNDAANWHKKPIEVKNSIEATNEYCLNLINVNEKFLFVDKNGLSKFISKNDVISIVKRRYTKAKDFYDNFMLINFEAMSSEIEYAMRIHGKKWKSVFRNSWDNNDSNPLLRRIRNYVGDEVFKLKTYTPLACIREHLVCSYMKGR